MVQKLNSDVEVNKPAYMYYLMSKSGQCSPTSDTLDSGTGSDLETTPTTNGNSYTLPTSLSASLTNAVSKSMRKFSDLSLDMGNGQRRLKLHSSNDSYNTDSEESESSLSCDSLNSSEIARMKNSTTTIIRTLPFGSSANECLEPSEGAIFTSDENNVTKINFLPRSLLRDIRDRSTTIAKNQSYANNTFANHTDADTDTDDFNDAYRMGSKTFIVKSHPKVCNIQKTMTSTTTAEAAAITPKTTTTTTTTSASYTTNEPFNLHHQRDTITNNDFGHLFPSNGKTIDPLRRVLHGTENRKPYENDKYISFHLNERVDNGGAMARDRESFDKTKDDDSFAGFRDICAPSSVASTIRSSKGTIRGVKNRVRNGIATFLQMQQTNVKNYKEKDAGKVVLYSTSMGIVRETYAKCANVKQILRTLLVKFEERDIFMSMEYQQEIKDRMQSHEVQVPQLFVDGQHIGNADQVERLNETGELRQMLKMYKTSNASQTCQICGGYRLMPCPSCSGSKKSVHRNHFTTEFVALKCMNCDEVGLVKCFNCN